jgi:hypothetical protein
MQKLKTLIVILLFSTIVTSLHAQDSTEPTSTINWFYSACEDRMVIDLNGTIQAGYDVYFQAFDGFGGTGNAITGLRRVPADGDYAVSQVVPWLGGETRILGTPISVVIRMARESDPDNTIFNEPAADFLATCAEPASTLINGEDLTSGILNPGDAISSSGVFTPDGSYLNPIIYLEPEPIVKIGARASDIHISGRTANPGLIYAECADVAGADPGVIFDTDEIIVYWSWFAKTADQVESHIANSSHVVTLNGQPFPEVRVSPIHQIEGDRNYWVFYTVNLGDKWQPGGYGVNFAVSWINTITDGYANFGPGSETELLDSGCFFTIEKNPWGVEVMYEQPSLPLKTYNN